VGGGGWGAVQPERGMKPLVPLKDKVLKFFLSKNNILSLIIN
jgi:hypothetical protein